MLRDPVLVMLRLRDLHELLVLLCRQYPPQSLEGAPLWAPVVLEEQLLGWTLQEMEGLES